MFPILLFWTSSFQIWTSLGLVQFTKGKIHEILPNMSQDQNM